MAVDELARMGKRLRIPPVLEEQVHPVLEDHPGGGRRGWFVVQRVIKFPQQVDPVPEDFFATFFENVW